jgi:hypothetical protein
MRDEGWPLRDACLEKLAWWDTREPQIDTALMASPTSLCSRTAPVTQAERGERDAGIRG